ncbi:MAG: hypothetical protein K0S57_2394 [Ramlibacter sp.]|jgi:hypothetical protein|nr:hypothetical protein [Ramlibacter sp.]
MATATRTARKAPAKRSTPAKKTATPAVNAATTVKAKKPKLVRDSFNIPKAEYAVLEELKARAAGLGRPAKKSEVVRAGVQALAAMKDAIFLAALDQLAPAKPAAKP